MKSSANTSQEQGIRAAEVLDFFDDLGLFAELEVDSAAASYQDASASAAFHDSLSSVSSAPPHQQLQSFSALLDAGIGVLEQFDANLLTPVEPLVQMDFHNADFDAVSTEAASDALGCDHHHLLDHLASGYDSELASVASEPAASETEVAERPKKKTKKKKKSTSQRQKEELSYLRGKLHEYETELQRIAQENKGFTATYAAAAIATTTTGSESETISAQLNAQSLWETMAKNQLEEKNRAELENAALKIKMEAQLKFAKSLERMLRKRKIWDGLQEPTPQRFMTLSAKDSETFEALTANIDTRARTADELFQAQGLTEMSPPKRDASIAFVDEEGMRIEFVHSTDAPFPADAVSAVVWKYLQKRVLKLNNLIFTTQIVEQTENSLLTTQRVASSAPSDARRITVHSAFKRIRQDHRLLFIWESVTECNASASRGTPAAQLISKGCGQILRRESASPDDPESSILQSYMCVVPTLWRDDASTGLSPGADDEGEQQQCLDTGLLTELTISAYEQNAQTVRQAIENALIDELLLSG